MKISDGVMSRRGVLAAVVFAAFAWAPAVGRAQEPVSPRPEVHRLGTHRLPPMNGEHLRTMLVEVDYPPGAVAATHRHACPVVAIVLEGAIDSKVEGQPERIYRPGETFYELPYRLHEVSRNASASMPAKLLAVFTCDADQPLTLPAKAAAGRAGKP